MPSRISLPTVAPGGETTADPPRPSADGERTAPWDVDGGADWQVVEDLMTGTRSVVLGGHQELRVPQGGRFAVEHSAQASVSRDRPDGARIEARSSIEMETTTGERIGVRTSSLFFRNRMTCSGEVSIDGREFYRRTWRNF